MVVTVKQQDNAFTLASSYGTVTEEILNQTTEISIIYGNFYTAPYRLSLCYAFKHLGRVAKDSWRIRFWFCPEY